MAYVTTMSHFLQQFMFAIIINALIKIKRIEILKMKETARKKRKGKKRINRSVSVHKNKYKNKNTISILFLRSF